MECRKMTLGGVIHNINTLLDRHHVPTRKRNKVLADILGLHYTSVQKKMISQKPWTREQLQQICEYYGAPISSLIDHERSGKVPALIRFGTKIQRGRISIGQELEDPASEDFIATQTTDGWVVMPGNAAMHEKCHRIDSMETLPPPAIALLDDEDDVRTPMTENFSRIGFDTSEYAATDGLIADLDKKHFEGFILDWMLSNNTTSEDVVHRIRKLPGGEQVPIIILTGKLETHLVEESELARMVQLYNAMIVEKPIRTRIIGMTLFSLMSRE
jgi:CheY-like chemotaxis protein